MQNAVENVKKKIWSFGYSCISVSGFPGVEYDLFVEGKYKVKVSLKEKSCVCPDGMIVAVIDNKKITYEVWESGVCRNETSPLKVFSKVGN